MSFKNLMVIKAAVCLVLGIFMLAAPAALFSIFGVELNSAGMLPAREYSSAMLGILFICWFGRNTAEAEVKKGIIAGMVVYNSFGVIVCVSALTQGILNSLGWLIVLLYLFFAAGFTLLLSKIQVTKTPAVIQ